MAIEIHIRVRDRDWDIENEFAYVLADKIQTLITKDVNIPVLVIPVEDPGNEMVPLIK